MVIEKPLFTWVHLSDIHVGHGDASHEKDQQLVLRALKEDIDAKSHSNEFPRPDAIIVTGDLAFSGNVRKQTEYQSAYDWLVTVGKSIGVPTERTFLVPGNHDVQLNVSDDDKNVGRLIEELRSGGQLDKGLDNLDDRVLLTKRLRNYLDFAKNFAPFCAEPEGTELYWVHQLTAASGLTIRLVGFNTSLLCKGGQTDHERLQLGKAQLVKAFVPDSETSNSETRAVVIVLTHHPFEWLKDGTTASNWVQKYAHIHLCGHIHEAQSDRSRSGGGKDFITVVSGAAHEEARTGDTAYQHGYNFGTLWARDDGQLILRVWPRIWSQANCDFRVDNSNVQNSDTFVDHHLRCRLSPQNSPDRADPRQGPGQAGYKPDVVDPGLSSVIRSETDKLQVGLLSTEFVGYNKEKDSTYEANEIEREFELSGAAVHLLDPTHVVLAILQNKPAAGYVIRDEVNWEFFRDLSILFVRRTRADDPGIPELIYDLLLYLPKIHPNLLILDPPDSFVRPVSKIPSLILRAQAGLAQGDRILIGRALAEKITLPFSYPVVAKPTHGWRGNKVEECRTVAELKKYLRDTNQNANTTLHYSVLVEKKLEIDDEFRVVVVGGEALGCVSKGKVPGTIRRNAAVGSHWKQANEQDAMQLAVKAAAAHNYAFAGVDIAKVGARYVVIECNRNPQFTAFDRATASSAAHAMVRYAVKAYEEFRQHSKA